MKPGRHIVVILLLLMLGIGCGALIGAFLGLTHDLPQIRALNDFKPSSVTRLLADDGTLLAKM